MPIRLVPRLPHARTVARRRHTTTPRGKSCPICGRRGKDFPRIRCTSNCLILAQLTGGKFARSLAANGSELASGCTSACRQKQNRIAPSVVHNNCANSPITRHNCNGGLLQPRNASVSDRIRPIGITCPLGAMPLAASLFFPLQTIFGYIPAASRFMDNRRNRIAHRAALAGTPDR